VSPRAREESVRPRLQSGRVLANRQASFDSCAAWASGRPLNFTVRCPVRSSLRFLVIATMALHLEHALADDPVKPDAPRLSPQQVSALAATAFEKSGANVANFREGETEFLAKAGIWLVSYVQTEPPFITDGNMMVVVNDHTGKACVQQAMLPPRPCT
jgi:hypothetical protein